MTTPAGAPPLPVATLAELLPWAAARYGDRVALITETGSCTFRDLDQQAARVGNALRQRGVGAGDRVSLYAGNSAEWVAGYHGVLRIGAVVNPVNALLTTAEMSYVLGDCRSVALLAGRDNLAPLAAGGILRELRAAVALDGQGPAGTLTFAELIRDQPDTCAPASVDPGALSTICYTSGTTGHPKGAMQSHHSVVFNATMTAFMHGRSRDDLVVSALPCAHVYGNVVIAAALICGTTVVLHRRFEEQALLDSIARHRATILDGVPAMYLMLLNHPALESCDLSSLRCCTVGGQSMPVAKMEAVMARFGCPIVELWGMTELAGLGTTFPQDQPVRLGSIGRPMPGVEARITDVQNPTRSLGADEAGELQIRGPIVMLGYFGNEAATRDTILADGWLRTGDIARQDADGYIHIVDRMKDMILSGGYNIYPAELERVIAAHPAVAMVAVAAVPDAIKGEVPKAWIVPRRDAVVTPDEIIAHCRAHLAAYKVPRQVRFVSDLPRTSTGKLMRRALRSLDAPADTANQGA